MAQEKDTTAERAAAGPCRGAGKGRPAQRGWHRQGRKPSRRAHARRLALPVLAAAILALGGPCIAAELRVSGDVTVGFGWLHSETGDTRSTDGTGEASILVSGSAPHVRARVELAVAEDEHTLDGAEHEVVWMPAGGLSVAMSGSAFEIASMESNTSVINAPEGAVGDDEANLDASGSGQVDVAYAFDAITVGLALTDSCVPECGYALAAGSPEPLFPDRERSSAILHLRGHAPGLAYNGYLARSAGRFPDSRAQGHGAGAGAGLRLGEGPVRAGLDASYARLRCEPAAGDTPCTADSRQRRVAVALWLGGFGIRHFRLRDKTDGETATVRSTDAVYLFDLDDLTVGPEFRTRTVESPGNPSLTDWYAVFGMSLGF